MKRLPLLTVLVFLLGTLAAHAAPTVDDLAKFVAGLPAKDSSLAALEKESWWTSYADELNKKWARMDERQLEHVRGWADGNSAVSHVSGTVYYMFSGPDFLYAHTFFPHAGHRPGRYSANGGNSRPVPQSWARAKTLARF